MLREKSISGYNRGYSSINQCFHSEGDMKIDLFQFMILAMKLELQKSTAKSHELVWLYIRNNCHIHFVGLKNTSKFQKK